jgi:large subunit ribosomal protein L36e
MAKGLPSGGHKVQPVKASARPSRRKGTLGKRTSFVRNLIKEVVGFAPYEKRVMELLKTGLGKDAKKALKLTKHRLGTHLRAKRKIRELEDAIRKPKGGK